MAIRRRKSRGRISFPKIEKGSIFYTMMFLIILAGGIMLISGQIAEAKRSKDTYDQQQQSIATGIEKERELLQDKKNIDNPALFEEIARKNGYRMENETVVNVTRPITEEDKWK